MKNHKRPYGHLSYFPIDLQERKDRVHSLRLNLFVTAPYRVPCSGYVASALFMIILYSDSSKKCSAMERLFSTLDSATKDHVKNDQKIENPDMNSLSGNSFVWTPIH